MFPKLKVFSAASFKDSEAAFNEWVETLRLGSQVNVTFHISGEIHEITAIYLEPQQEPSIARPNLQFTGRRH